MKSNSIKDLHDFLELNIKSNRREADITSHLFKSFENESNEEIKREIKWECLAFDFYLKNGKITPFSYNTTEEGEIVNAYPSLKDFENGGLKYIEERSKNVTNEFLLIRYNQILWNSRSPYKHQSQAVLTIDTYYQILEKLNCLKEEKRVGRDCLDLLNNGFGLSIQIKYKTDDYKKIIHSWLFEKNKFPVELKPYLIKYMIGLTVFKKEDFNGCLDLIKKLGYYHKEKTTDFFAIKDIYETGLHLAKRIGSDAKIWNKRIADSIVRMADFRMDDESRMIPLSFLKEAIIYYKAAGLHNKVKKIEHRYFELKKELRLGKFEVPVDENTANELQTYFNNKVERLLKCSQEDIFGYLLTGSDIFPKKKWLVNMSKENSSSFLDGVTTMKFDINNNVSKEKENKATKLNAKLYESYHHCLNLTILPFLQRIFIEGIKNGKITYRGFIEFIFKNTWLGQTLTDYDTGGEIIEYKWISVIAPSVHEYFVQTESALKSSNYGPVYILPIDSLTLKFEGVLRDFRLVNVSTTVTGKRDVLREKYIEELLDDKKIQEYFDEDDLLLFKFLFVSKDGMNLRNNIAHSFFRFNNYNFQIMHLLICAFLRIGKYKIGYKTTSKIK